MPQKFPLEQLEDAIMDGTIGHCFECGAENYQVEPDACNYHCEDCGENQVFGAEELLIMGAIE